MIKTLSRYEIANELASDENANFSYSGGLALADFFEETEDRNNPIEFCNVEIRCDFSEYETLEEWAGDYFSNWTKDLEIEPEHDQGEIDEIIRDYINSYGFLIEFYGGVIVSSF